MHACICMLNGQPFTLWAGKGKRARPTADRGRPEHQQGQERQKKAREEKEETNTTRKKQKKGRKQNKKKKKGQWNTMETWRLTRSKLFQTNVLPVLRKSVEVAACIRMGKVLQTNTHGIGKKPRYKNNTRETYMQIVLSTFKKMNQIASNKLIFDFQTWLLFVSKIVCNWMRCPTEPLFLPATSIKLACIKRQR